MEFNEKLQELRKRKGLTQEELAQALYVSRTAVSKWESGRGYPSIDSLKELAKFFSVTIDELIRSEEVMIAAEKEKMDFVRKYAALICSLLDIFTAILLVIPVFGDGQQSPAAVSLYMLSGTQSWIKTMFFALIILTVLNGICGCVISGLDKPVWMKHRIVTGIGSSILCCAVFILTRQPYAGIICFALLVAKGIFVVRM